MKALLWLAAAYVGIGVYKCMTSADGVGQLPAGCPSVIGAGTSYPNGMPAGCTAQPACSNKNLQCVLSWPMWNATKCNTNF
jgi:hypothetical protein